MLKEVKLDEKKSIINLHHNNDQGVVDYTREDPYVAQRLVMDVLLLDYGVCVGRTALREMYSRLLFNSKVPVSGLKKPISRRTVRIRSSS